MYRLRPPLPGGRVADPGGGRRGGRGVGGGAGVPAAAGGGCHGRVRSERVNGVDEVGWYMYKCRMEDVYM